MARRGGNSDNPFSTDGEGGIDWSGQQHDPSGFKPNGSGSSPKDKWGQPDSAVGIDHINKYSNQDDTGAFEYGFSNEKTILDRPLNASPARVKKTSAQDYYEGDDRWYRGGKKG